MKLSVIFFARNDNYNNGRAGTYLDRLNMSINSLHLALKGKEWELVLVDYNPISKKHLLSNLFNSDHIRHIVVGSDQHRNIISKHAAAGAVWKTSKGNLSHKEIYKFPFIAPYAFNEGVRCASGEYILTTSTDNIFPKNFSNLVDDLRPNIVYRAMLKSVSQGSAMDQWEKIARGEKYDTPKKFKRRNKVKGRSFNKACGDFMLVDRDSWKQIGGLIPVCHVRARGLDSLALFYFMSLGKKIYCPKFYIVNIHRSPIKYRMSMMWEINYAVSANGISYDHEAELRRPEYESFWRYAADKPPYNNQFYEQKFGFNVKRIQEIKELFSVIQGYPIVG